MRLSGQAFSLLAILVERRGEIVTREELKERLWPSGTFVGFDDSLNTIVNKLRAVLDDEATNPRFIETIPRRGYRFIAPVEELAEAGGAAESPSGARPEHSRQATENIPGGAVSAFRRSRIAMLLSFAALLLLAAGGYAWFRAHEKVATAAAPPIRSLAVLPFANFSPDPGQDYLADGMTDELITDLAQIGSLRVVSRTSVSRYKGTREPVGQIRKDLGVDAVVEGSVVRSGDTVRVNAQLIETSDDRHLWAQSFTREEKDIVALQDDVAQAVAERVEAAVLPEVRARLARAQPVNAVAYEAYLHGVSRLVHHSDADLLKSLAYFKQAAAVDPAMAGAYAGEAEAYCYLGDYNALPDRVAWPQAEIAANHALALDDSIGKAHAARALALWRYEWNWKGAEAEFQRALALTPNDSDTHHIYGLFLAAKGDFHNAEEELRIAGQLDPLSLIIRTNMGWLSYFQHDFGGAIAQYRAVLQTDPDFAPAHQKLWIAYALDGKTSQAADELSEVFRIFHHEGLLRRLLPPGSAATHPAFRAEAVAYAGSGDVTPYEKARALAVIHEDRGALESLQEAQARHDTWLVYAGIEPGFAALHAAPQFQRLLASLGMNGSPHAPVPAEAHRLSQMTPAR